MQKKKQKCIVLSLRYFVKKSATFITITLKKVDFHNQYAKNKMKPLVYTYVLARVWMGCAIFCRRADSGGYYTPRVELNDLGVSPYFPDGTWCHREKNLNYYCLHHHCLPEVISNLAAVYRQPNCTTLFFRISNSQKLTFWTALVKTFPSRKTPDRCR
jgi:hypothetical protein